MDKLLHLSLPQYADLRNGHHTTNPTYEEGGLVVWVWS